MGFRGRRGDSVSRVSEAMAQK